MEQPKPETEQATGNDPTPKPESKGSDHAPNGDGKWTSFVLGSESQTQSQDQVQSPREGSPTKTASSGSRKSVHWSPELVRESSTISSPHGSNNNNNNNSYYVSPSPTDQSSSSFKVKGIPLFLSLSLSVRIRMYVCMQYSYMNCVFCLVWGSRYDGQCTECSREMGKEGWRSY